MSEADEPEAGELAGVGRCPRPPRRARGCARSSAATAARPRGRTRRSWRRRLDVRGRRAGAGVLGDEHEAGIFGECVPMHPPTVDAGEPEQTYKDR